MARETYVLRGGALVPKRLAGPRHAASAAAGAAARAAPYVRTEA